MTIDHIIRMVSRFGTGTLHPCDLFFLGMEWCGKFYVYLALPFCLHLAPYIQFSGWPSTMDPGEQHLQDPIFAALLKWLHNSWPDELPFAWTVLILQMAFNVCMVDLLWTFHKKDHPIWLNKEFYLISSVEIIFYPWGMPSVSGYTQGSLQQWT